MTNPITHGNSWGTKSEIEWIDHAGEFSLEAKKLRMSPNQRRLRILKRYRDFSCVVRSDWASIDKEEVMNHLLNVIAFMEMRVKEEMELWPRPKEKGVSVDGAEKKITESFEEGRTHA